MIPVVCSSILSHVGTSFVFERVDGDIITEDMIRTIIGLMKTLILLPSMQSRFSESLSKLLVVSHKVDNIESNFAHFLNEVYDQFYKTDEKIDIASEKYTNKLTISYEFVERILQYIQINADKFKKMQIPQIFYNILYWPLSLPLNRNEVILLFILSLQFTHDCNSLDFFIGFSLMFLRKIC